MDADEFLPVRIHAIWGHRRQATSWELQVMLVEVEGEVWISRRSPLIRGRCDELIVHYHGVSCLRIEVQLLYTAQNRRPKDVLDFEACLPHRSADAKHWLQTNLLLLYGAGHPWLDELA